MCGLTGFLLNRQIDIPLAEQRLDAMVDTVNYRGPDDRGIWSNGKIGLGFARLSIIDLSPAGHQPMSALDGEVWLTFNGEIYNFQSIRQNLEKCGHRFRSRSDSEVILRGYLEWGDDILNHLRGMFAIAIWDNRTKRMLLARDRIGKKPLVYTQNSEGVFFGSEIKTILSWPTISSEPALDALHQYLTYQYIPAPLTAFKGVRKLPAGHKMIINFDANGNAQLAKPERYWHLASPRPRCRQVSEKELAEELVHQLEESVRIRMIADVPLGAFLSGGVDSSAIVAMMARHSSHPVKTFSIGFENDEYDETLYAKMVADQYGTDHHVLVVKPDAVNILPKLIHHYNEPFADPSAVPTFYLAELTRHNVTVALNGDGGDEAFLGYGRYQFMESISSYDQFPKPLRRIASFLLKRIPIPGWKKKHRSKFARELLADQQAPQYRFAPTISAFTDDHKMHGYGDAMREYANNSALDILYPYFEEAENLVTGANWADIHIYLPDDLMVKVDIATMAHSLESRSPLLDHKFMEWALTIPQNVLMNSNRTKALFKKAMEPYLPREVLYRKKMGFGCPVDHWLRGDLKEMAYDNLLSEKCSSRGIVDSAFTKKLLDEHCIGKTDHSTRLWPLLVLELWFQIWIDEKWT